MFRIKLYIGEISHIHSLNANGRKHTNLSVLHSRHRRWHISRGRCHPIAYHRHVASCQQRESTPTYYVTHNTPPTGSDVLNLASLLMSQCENAPEGQKVSIYRQPSGQREKHIVSKLLYWNQHLSTERWMNSKEYHISRWARREIMNNVRTTGTQLPLLLHTTVSVWRYAGVCTHSHQRTRKVQALNTVTYLIRSNQSLT